MDGKGKERRLVLRSFFCWILFSGVVVELAEWDLIFRFFGDFDDGEYHGGYEEENEAVEDILEQFWGMCVLLDGCLGM